VDSVNVFHTVICMDRQHGAISVCQHHACSYTTCSA